jgi:ABC-type transport system involved in cytochrome c biogenesis permease subunit
MERPPITSLYETIIFITTTGVVLALLAEWMMKKGWALAVASVAGTAGMFLSIRFMNMEGRDTMELLQAVLITNFWLATHVPCINLGYAAGMVSAIFSVLYVILRVFGKVKLGDATAKDLTRMCYAFVIVGLFLSLVGTVLGGIWANYSWGRFWGWDPKENGALMIVLVNLVILHARMGGYIREIGFHVCGLLLGMVVAFSWFATNQLGVGLHAYGAMEGAWMWLYLFWGFLALLMVVAGFISLRDKAKGSSKPDPLPDAAKAAV